ncbi:MAG: hypothetical protein COZ31_02810 [Nitrospirae bacterium CG_4_10_14_3_um_filter_44_29]|nr:MAG: hypothetical protein COS28_07025 [Nitrospirae bacterium CG02_land_8_20_14_3_00_44_33]PIV67292.1 MAG: hypothetical protein COS10_01810 [Nitrospirae bacterium CG01_land_8_20_14_3_00_44_22]PIX89288.1 MAG: hypothetical protein COZ31_02810 [Nitrospirae bacterium CG_4_10_14_3_um_filter_44_29]PJA82551.1 MAG: hypothetical protein CO147_04480 [Nitrospirae bacterium CG_4_9_14_3_um_filter_44_28]
MIFCCQSCAFGFIFRHLVWGISFSTSIKRSLSLIFLTALVPERTKDIAVVGVRALVAATLATLMTAAVAGTFFNQSSILLGR